MSKQTVRTLLVTSALPYANGPLHLGHLLEQVQTDIWVRVQKSRGHRCLYLCADDAHGTAIMLSAEQSGISPERQIALIHAEHVRDSADFLIEFDNFHTTHSDENRHFSELIYSRLLDRGYIVQRDIVQAYDPQRGLFLSDRYIKGTCPRCGAADQYGDNCEICGAAYSPTELVDAVSILSGAQPEQRQSRHFFFDLPQFEGLLRNWIGQGTLQSAIANKLQEWLQAGLREWDISRDAPYFGFGIPGQPGKFFYVSLDAPIGYMASHRNLCDREHQDFDFDHYWRADSDTELYHFIGKDIINFHGLFWPAMLSAAGYRMPTAIHAHGFLTVNGTKMSKSRGTFIKARTYLEHLDAEYLRYYFAAKLGAGVEDIDLNLEDFVQRVNSDVIGKVVNIASRCAGFLHRGFDGRLSEHCSEPELVAEFCARGEIIAQHYEQRDFARAVREIMALADRANQYINDRQPWVLAKRADGQTEVHQVCSVALNLFRILMVYLQPILPATARRAGEFLDAGLGWEQRHETLCGHRIHHFQPLLTRVETAQVEAVLAASREEETAAA